MTHSVRTCDLTRWSGSRRTYPAPSLSLSTTDTSLSGGRSVSWTPAPPGTARKGADAGIDGYINFFDDNSGKPKRIVVQVKSGNVQRNQIATLKSDMEREKADLALFVTLKPPTGPMVNEALGAGFYAPEAFPDHNFRRCRYSPSKSFWPVADLTIPATLRRQHSSVRPVVAVRADKGGLHRNQPYKSFRKRHLRKPSTAEAPI